MSRGVAATSVFTSTEMGWPLQGLDVPDELAVSVVTVGELRAGVLLDGAVAVRNRRLAALTVALSFDPLAVDEAVIEAWAVLRVILRETGLQLPVNDSWVAATALAHGASLVTHDADLAEVPGLSVVRV